MSALYQEEQRKQLQQGRGRGTSRVEDSDHGTEESSTGNLNIKSGHLT